MFAYCGNNPVNYYDVTGYIPQAIEDAIVHNKVLKEIAGQITESTTSSLAQSLYEQMKRNYEV